MSDKSEGCTYLTLAIVDSNDQGAQVQRKSRTRLAGLAYRTMLMNSMTKIQIAMITVFLGMECYFIFSSKIYQVTVTGSMYIRLSIWLGIFIGIIVLLHMFSRGGMRQGKKFMKTIFFNEKPVYTKDLRSYQINIAGKIAFLRALSIMLPMLYLCFVPDEQLNLLTLGAAAGYFSISNSLCTLAIQILHMWQADLEKNYEDVDQWVDDKAYVQSEIAAGRSVWARRYFL